MGQKHRLYTFQIKPEDFSSFVKHLQGSPYSDDQAQGFDLEIVRDRKIQGRYFEKRSELEELIDPFGKPFQNLRIWFDEISFIVDIENTFLELISPPRKLSTFLNALASAANFEAVIEEKSIDLKRLIRKLAETADAFLLKKLVADSKTAFPGLDVRYQVRGKNVGDSFGRVLGLEESKILTIDATFRLEEEEAIIQVNKNGSFKFESNASTQLVHQIREIILSM